MPVKIIKNNQIHCTERKINCSVHNHQIEIGNGIFPGVELPVAIITQKHFNANDNNIKRSTIVLILVEHFQLVMI